MATHPIHCCSCGCGERMASSYDGGAVAAMTTHTNVPFYTETSLRSFKGGAVGRFPYFMLVSVIFCSDFTRYIMSATAAPDATIFFAESTRVPIGVLNQQQTASPSAQFTLIRHLSDFSAAQMNILEG